MDLPARTMPATRDVLIEVEAELVLLAVVGGLFGYFLVELATYWDRFGSRDHLRFRILAIWLALAELMYFAIHVASTYTAAVSLVQGGDGLRPSILSIWSIVITTLLEATIEGFFVFRLWLVTRKRWVRSISAFLWAFSFSAHAVWVGIAGRHGRSNITSDPKQLVCVQIAFWGCFVSGCLLYELQFAEDRKIIRRSNSAIGQLVSLAMRTSGILVVFELLVAVAVSITRQPEHALVTEVQYAATIYTILGAIIILFTLNWRSTIRDPSRSTGVPGKMTMANFQMGMQTQAPADVPSFVRPSLIGELEQKQTPPKEVPEGSNAEVSIGQMLR
ncbi:hypothetical protein NBRC10512_000585 [Rhodotorula toruloides]|uniref:RHTO0S04e09054g1_1 n=2 Tax=Rhodotorula toruloides TaxID=5286 RepID=A0A061AYF3_RHOTO|nr:uncharacterized protein RHTO_05226 [Rhodotorula toruloides NP11]EMS19279.1 hypothetical protein RHTO_05226 [Rhodotorula toruloides NP11]CDR39769.1 RHTO0S04e09054g1_1 [Rhodotorula toruloides]